METEWQKTQRNIIDMNLRYINSPYFQRYHNILYKELVSAKALGQLKFFLTYAREHMGSESLTRDGRRTFFLSIRKASELMKAEGYKGVSKDAINRKLILLSMLGFFDKVEEQNIPGDVLQRAILVAHNNSITEGTSYDYRQDFFSIPFYNAKMFTAAEEFIIMNREKSARRSSLSREQILRTYGKDAADSVYSQDIYKGNTKRSVKFYAKYKEIAEMVIQAQGIVSEREILNRFKGYGGEEKKNLSGQCLPQLLGENGYQRIRVNKENREKYQIPSKYTSGSFVIIKRTKNQ